MKRLCFALLLAFCLSVFLPTFSSAKKVVTPDDFAFLGAFQAPVSNYATGLTYRYVDGNFRLYMIQNNRINKPEMSISEELVEFSVPDTLSMAKPFPSAAVTANFGNIFANYLEDAGTGRVNGIYWDEQDQRMYWMAIRSYNVTNWLPSWGYSTLNYDTQEGTAMGIWHASDQDSNGGYDDRFHGAMLSFPADFANTYLGGRRLGLGMQHYVSIVTNGPYSYGPTLFATHPINPAITASGGIANGDDLLPVMYHPGFGTPHPEAQRARKPWKMMNNIGGKYYGINDYWSWKDGGNAMVFVDTADYHGLMMFFSLVQGTTNTTITSVLSDRQIVIADPSNILVDDLLTVEIDGGDCYMWSSQPHCVERGTVESISGNTITFTQNFSATPLQSGIVRGGFWYEDSATRAQRKRKAWYTYDPVDLGNAASNPTTYPTDQVTPHYAEKMTVLDEKETTASRGAVFDPVTNKLYLAVKYDGEKSLVYVYQLVGQSPKSPSGLKVVHE